MINKISEIVQTFCDSSEPPHSSTSLLKSGILNSMDLISLIAELEKEFNIKIPTEDIDFETFDSIKDIEKCIKEKLSSE